ncbi:hypothetical protein EB796_000709 [Bugula neritina]|uniref:Uncharacterized protein n=1 Tax=Bugula neritina TaxID=10212 RepID=A0A7J7KS40_BUGNE|nr:hypothetical protein EB796_000709 [Bugula neritina]
MPLYKKKYCASQIIGKNIRFHGKNENSPLVGGYVDVVRNMEDKTCVNARVNGKPVLLLVKELEKMCMRLTAVLRSGPIRMYKNEYIPCQNESNPLVGCYVDVVRDLKDKTCIIACLNGKLVLLPVEELENMCMKLTVVLRSGPV